MCIGYGYGKYCGDCSSFIELFDWLGIDDFILYLCVFKVIEVVGGMLFGGWDDVWFRN